MNKNKPIFLKDIFFSFQLMWVVNMSMAIYRSVDFIIDIVINYMIKLKSFFTKKGG